MFRLTFSFMFKLNLLCMSSFSLMVAGQIRDRRAEDTPRGKIVGQQSVAPSTVYQNYVERAAAARSVSGRMYPDNYRSNVLKGSGAYYSRNQNSLYGSPYSSYAYPSSGYDTNYSYGAYGYPNMMNDYSYGSYGYPNQMFNPNYSAYGPTMDPYYSGSGYSASAAYPGYPSYPGYQGYQGYQNYPGSPVPNYMGNPYYSAYPGYRSYNPGMYGPNTTFVNPPPAINNSTGYPGYSQSYFRYR